MKSLVTKVLIAGGVAIFGAAGAYKLACPEGCCLLGGGEKKGDSAMTLQTSLSSSVGTGSTGEAAKPVHLTGENFATTLAGTSQPVLVDFWAPWCGPCRAIAPTIDAVAGEFVGRAVVGKLDVDEAGAIAQKYGVQSIPTLIIFKDGEPVDRIVGMQSKDEISRRLAKAAG